MGVRTVSITHILREENQFSYYLANTILNEGEMDVESFQDLRVEGRKLINNDKLNLPYLKIRPFKR